MQSLPEVLSTLARARQRFGLCLFFAAACTSAHAQRPAVPQPASPQSAPAQDLPSAPAPTSAVQPIKSTATITGVVMDTDGAAIPGAIVTLEDAESQAKRTTVSGPDGAFTFPDIPSGNSSITIAAIGFSSATIPAFVTQPGETLSLPPLTLQLAVVDTSVQAISQHDMAEQQLKVEEQQRLFGVVPNFYVSYTWNAVPLSSGQKFKLALRSSIDPFTFVGAGISAGIEQGNDTYPGYGLGAAGFAKRYGAAYGDALIGTFIGGAVLPSLLHQDPRYFYKGTGSVPSRALYAMSTVFRTRGDNGRWQPNYSDFFGDLAAGAISNAYYPPGDRGVQTTFDNFGLDILSDTINALVQEFVLRKVTHHPPPTIPENP